MAAPTAKTDATPGNDELSAMLRSYVDVAQRLQHTHETLQHEVARLRRELASKDRELERRRRLASLGELAAGVAHEVRNPLGAISLYSDLLRGECRGRGVAIDLIEKIEAGIKAIDGIVQDTLALAPRGGRLARCDLRRIVAEAHDACRAVLTECGVTATFTIDDADVCVPADAGALTRVFVNLIANAAQASRPGAVVHTAVEKVDDQWVEAHVIDSGCGLPPEALDRIFDPFFTTRAKGTGLGLTIAHRLVEAHGGKLRARNRAGGGAEFIVELPMSREPAEAGAPGATTAA